MAGAIATSTLVLGALVALVTWQPIEYGPSFGVDPSWHAALNMAAHLRLRWGTEVIYNYGPLGFLGAPLSMYGGLATLGAVYVVVVRVALAAAVVWIGRGRGFPLAVTIVLALAVSAFASVGVQPAVPLVFLCCAAALGEDPPRGARSLVVYGGGFVAALETLVKLNDGLAVLVMVVATVIALSVDRRAILAWFGGTFAVSLAALWFATGQGLGNLPDYIVTSAAIIGGYSAAMQLPADGPVIVVASVVVAAVLVTAWVVARRLPTARRIGFLAVVLVFAFVSWKEGVVRDRDTHVAILFGWLLVPWIVFAGRRVGRAEAAVGFAATVVLLFAATGSPISRYAHPIDSPRDAVNEVRALVVPSTRDALNNRQRFYLTAAYGLDRRTLSLIGDRPIEIYPWETTLAWAYGLNWDPLPVFRSPAVYTPSLDRKNADALSSPNGPRLILRHSANPTEPSSAKLASIDGRYGPYDEPAATLATLCNFRALRTTSRYQLLGRTPDRCAAPRRISSVDADYGEPIEVPHAPRPDEVVFAKVSGLTPSGTERLQSLLYRPAIRRVRFDRGPSYRFVPATAGDGLVLTAPRRIDFPSPWKVAPDTRTITFERSSAIALPTPTLRVEFYAMPVRPPAR